MSDTDNLLQHVDIEDARRRLQGAGSLTPHRVADALRKGGRPVSDAVVLAVYELLRNEYVIDGGLLRPLLLDPDTVDIRVQGVDVFVNGELSDVKFADEGAVRRLAQRLAAQSDQQRLDMRLDDSRPYVETRLPNGARFRAFLGSQGLPTVIHIQPNYDFTLDERVRLRMISPEAAAFLADILNPEAP